MVTGFEVKMYADIEKIARSLDRIASCLEAAELRARRMEEEAGTTSPTKHS